MTQQQHVLPLRLAEIQRRRNARCRYGEGRPFYCCVVGLHHRGTLRNINTPVSQKQQTGVTVQPALMAMPCVHRSLQTHVYSTHSQTYLTMEPSKSTKHSECSMECIWERIAICKTSSNSKVEIQARKVSAFKRNRVMGQILVLCGLVWSLVVPCDPMWPCVVLCSHKRPSLGQQFPLFQKQDNNNYLSFQELNVRILRIK